MNKYTELKDRHGKEVNAFPMAFAFSNEQFEEAKKKLGVSSPEELLSTPAGGMIRKTDKKAFTDMYIKHLEETKEAQKDDEYLYQGFLYELGNHEFCITYDPTDTLDCFGIDLADVTERIKTIFNEAKKEYLAGCE